MGEAGQTWRASSHPLGTRHACAECHECAHRSDGHNEAADPVCVVEFDEIDALQGRVSYAGLKHKAEERPLARRFVDEQAGVPERVAGLLNGTERPRNGLLAHDGLVIGGVQHDYIGRKLGSSGFDIPGVRGSEKALSCVHSLNDDESPQRRPSHRSGLTT
jgi:hypothetical protein